MADKTHTPFNSQFAKKKNLSQPLFELTSFACLGGRGGVGWIYSFQKKLPPIAKELVIKNQGG